MLINNQAEDMDDKKNKKSSRGHRANVDSLMPNALAIRWKHGKGFILHFMSPHSKESFVCAWRVDNGNVHWTCSWNLTFIIRKYQLLSAWW